MKPNCLYENCGRVANRRGMCDNHYATWLRKNKDKVGPSKSKWNNPDGSRALCIVDSCKYEVKYSGLCAKHYQRMDYLSGKGAYKASRNRKRRDLDGNPLDLRCTFEGCSTPEFNPGLCAGHYYQKLRGVELTPLREEAPCPIRGCGGVYSVKRTRTGLCRMHAAACSRYSISPDRMVELFERGECNNPGCHESENLHIDHDHACCPGNKSCGQCVRGVLCQGCNTALGALRESPEVIVGLIDYLKNLKCP
jgi:hypothetical protein